VGWGEEWQPSEGKQGEEMYCGRGKVVQDLVGWKVD